MSRGYFGLYMYIIRCAAKGWKGLDSSGVVGGGGRGKVCFEEGWEC
ncbi:hypothetical protein GCM10010129_84300 [Streptomyces fumigatiscleroticus]|nr:hypothetical protein GCM10010129_84300 [Streptomyces fumigatiscleroticus]